MSSTSSESAIALKEWREPSARTLRAPATARRSSCTDPGRTRRPEKTWFPAQFTARVGNAGSPPPEAITRPHPCWLRGVAVEVGLRGGLRLRGGQHGAAHYRLAVHWRGPSTGGPSTAGPSTGGLVAGWLGVLWHAAPGAPAPGRELRLRALHGRSGLLRLIRLLPLLPRLALLGLLGALLGLLGALLGPLGALVELLLLELGGVDRRRLHGLKLRPVTGASGALAALAAPALGEVS